MSTLPPSHPNASSAEEQLFDILNVGDTYSPVDEKAEKDIADKVQKCLTDHPNLDKNFVSKNRANGYQNTLLLVALEKEHLDAALILLAQGADPWKTNAINLNASHMLAMVHVTKKHEELATVDNINQTKLEKTLRIFRILSDAIKKFATDQKITHEAAVARTINGLAGGQGDRRSALAMALVCCTPLIKPLMDLGGQYLGDRSLWSQLVINVSTGTLRIPELKTLFPQEFTWERLIQPCQYSDQRNAIEQSIAMNNLAFLQYCFDANSKAALDIINNRAEPKRSALHTLLATQGSYCLNEGMIFFLLDKGGDPSIVHQGKTFFQRLTEMSKGTNEHPRTVLRQLTEKYPQHFSDHNPASESGDGRRRPGL